MFAPDHDSDEFHKHLGYCIAAWSKIEEHLFEMCWRALGSTEERAAVVYYRTPSIDARISLVNELAKTVLPTPERLSGGHPHPDPEAWDDIRKRISALLKTRNRIAHHPVHRNEIEILNGALTVPFYQSYVSGAESLRGRHDDVLPLHVGDLQAHHQIVLSLANELQNFYLMKFLPHLR